ncbi:hypothetical protein [Pseudonocardia sp. HH130630-07]|uniref:hypothetical protein n=1 Tax=Pseudonocardia sp. HH130630-07 TaxID=1690815 RepID=UPI0008150BCA|nr:hypothetical protein [Pseudonocardia sp. HH130630-07]ANY06807.1 hypothetical protein AFB00_11480 [Pseudonocardia sp. HH130630-07]
MPYDVVSAYTLVLGEASDDATDPQGQPQVTVHSTATDAWRALDRAVRERCGMRPRPRRSIDPDAVIRLADAWRAADPEARYWQVTAHRLPIMVPELARTSPGGVGRFCTEDA